MIDRWMPHLRVPMSEGEFRRLPRHPAYLYGYVEGSTVVSPNPRMVHASLKLEECKPHETTANNLSFRAATSIDFEKLVDLFAAAFDRVQPFAALDYEERREAGRACLERTLTGGDGPWIDAASFVAIEAPTGRLVAGLLTTLLPIGDPREYDTYLWPDPPPEDAIERRLGQPHLTWLMTAPGHSRQGIARTLLNRAVAQLREMGYEHLLTTILLGAEASLLWHWGAGFQVVSKRMR